MQYDRKDHFYKKAKKEGKASRAVYKLAELQKKFHLVKNGSVALDLGSAPGGWMQDLSQMVGVTGKVIGVDLLPLKIQLLRNCVFFLGNLEDEEIRAKISDAAGGLVDSVLSDMAPNISGIAFADAHRSFLLASLALDMCEALLKNGGGFVVKIFPGEDFANFKSTMKKKFERVAQVVPEATRKTSNEVYLVGVGFKRNESV